MVSVAYDSQEPVLFLIDGNDDVILFEQVHVLGPAGHACMSFLCSAHISRFLVFIGSGQPLIEEWTEDEGFASFFLRQNVEKEIFEVKVDYDIVEVSVGLQTRIIVDVDRDPSRTLRVDKE